MACESLSSCHAVDCVAIVSPLAPLMDDGAREDGPVETDD